MSPVSGLLGDQRLLRLTANFPAGRRIAPLPSFNQANRVAWAIKSLGGPHYAASFSSMVATTVLSLAVKVVRLSRARLRRPLPCSPRPIEADRPHQRRTVPLARNSLARTSSCSITCQSVRLWWSRRESHPGLARNIHVFNRRIHLVSYHERRVNGLYAPFMNFF
jgi:hypothetical protein